MTDRSRTDQRTGQAGDRLVVLLADPLAMRRRQLLRGPLRHQVIEAASLTEAFPLAEDLSPHIMALSADFLIEPEIEGLIRVAGLLEATVFLYAEDGTAPGGLPLRHRPRCVPVRPSDGLDDLLSRLAGPEAPCPGPDIGTTPPELVLIGASTGGIAALETVLMAFPADCPPTLVVQHIREGFVAGLVQRLNLRCRPRVVEALDDQPLRRGTVYFAADAGRHLTVSGRAVPRSTLRAAPPCHGHRPAVDPLFESAIPWASRASAAILTGMGSDGARGLHALRRAGAHTIAQDRATSIIWGMPGAAVEAGAAEAVLPIGQIGPALLAGRRRAASLPLAGRAR
ncbi:CheB methylesterase domain-containing protein [Paracoccus sp. (in: a-proteobacteria)]|uniref:CheB methylesterase domain-containing protein n=1 Tax=Paracoccus sp. TaxID=267 RepID=UPI00272BD102|nr:CheB methylesterase domain-containing protein [Paracoccus sp. (in: a-proteobacteria)]